MDKQQTKDFLKGQADCANGVEHSGGKGEYYDRGYSAQYQHEQNMTHMTGGRNGN
jgi:hypothetical protein